MGYSSRSETQQFAPKNIKKLNEVKDVPADAFIATFAEHLKKTEKIK